MIERNRRSVLLGVATLLAIPAFAGVARAGNPSGHDGNSTSGGGGSSRGEHDNHYTCPPKSPPEDNHDNPPA